MISRSTTRDARRQTCLNTINRVRKKGALTKLWFFSYNKVEINWFKQCLRWETIKIIRNQFWAWKSFTGQRKAGYWKSTKWEQDCLIIAIDQQDVNLNWKVVKWE